MAATSGFFMDAARGRGKVLACSMWLRAVAVAAWLPLRMLKNGRCQLRDGLRFPLQRCEILWLASTNSPLSTRSGHHLYMKGCAIQYHSLGDKETRARAMDKKALSESEIFTKFIAPSIATRGWSNDLQVIESYSHRWAPRRAWQQGPSSLKAVDSALNSQSPPRRRANRTGVNGRSADCRGFLN